MKQSTILIILYGFNLALALVGAGFLAAFLGQLYAEDPLMVFEMPVAVWVNGVIAFFALLIVYLTIWIVFRVIHFESGFSAVVADVLAMIVFTLGGIATTAGLTGENVFRLNCRAQPMWHDVLALCLPAAIGAAVAWAQIGLLLLTLTFILVTMRDYPDGWKRSMYRLCHPLQAKPIIHLDKNGSRTSSFGTPTSTEHAPLVGLIPEYPARGAQYRTLAHRPSESISSNSNGSLMSPTSIMSPTSPMSPVSVANWSPSRPFSPIPRWPTRLPPAGIYEAYADSAPIATQSYWMDDSVISSPEPASLEMDRTTLYRQHSTSLELERLVTPPSPTPGRISRDLESQQLYYEKQPLSPLRLANPPPFSPAGVRRVPVPPLEAPGQNGRGFGASRAAHQRGASSPSPSLPLLEKEYAAVAMNRARPLSQDFNRSSGALSLHQASPFPSYPLEKHTYPPGTMYDEATPLSAPSTPRMRRQFQVYGKESPPVPPRWKDKGEREHDRKQAERAHRKLSLEHAERGEVYGRPRNTRSAEGTYPDDYSDFGYVSDAVLPQTSSSHLPKPISPGEALALPLPRNEWEPRRKNIRPGDVFRV